MGFQELCYQEAIVQLSWHWLFVAGRLIISIFVFYSFELRDTGDLFRDI